MGYRIKTVSKLTGVPRNTLLAWERRYGLVMPSRQDNGYREYSDSDIACLQSVKRLLDQGYKVSEAVELIQTVREQGTEGVPRPGCLSVAVLHRTLSETLTSTSTHSPIQVTYSATSAEGFLDEHCDETADILVASLELLGGEPLEALRQSMQQVEATQAIVLYQFATHATLQRLVGANVRLLHGSPRVAVVKQAIEEQAALHQLLTPRRTPLSPPTLPPPAEGTPPRRFDDAQLARLREVRSGIDCECPNHLATMVSSLLAFEAYTRGCEARNPRDAALHSYLSQTTGAARKLLEEMLEAVIVQDQIEI